jgi:hypothetical protein
MQILWAFRCNPLRMGEQQNCDSKFATSPLRRKRIYHNGHKGTATTIAANDYAFRQNRAWRRLKRFSRAL